MLFYVHVVNVTERGSTIYQDIKAYKEQMGTTFTLQMDTTFIWSPFNKCGAHSSPIRQEMDTTFPQTLPKETECPGQKCGLQ